MKHLNEFSSIKGARGLFPYRPSQRWHAESLKAVLVLLILGSLAFASAVSAQKINGTGTDGTTGVVNVTATGGTPAATYPTLKDAFDAINLGTHLGVITINIAASTIELAAPAVLNSTGAGAASYTSILIQPSADGVTVAGATPTGRGLIELNGADNVTIDGDNPNTAGTNRNLTVQNTAAATVTFTSVIRIALAATVVNTADGNTFRNLNVIGSSPGRNIATAISTTGSENTTFGIFAGPGASTVSATTAPAAITSVSTGVGAGATANNLVIGNNSFSGSMARAISINGAAATVFPSLQISNNVIGNPTAGAVDQVTAIGITVNGSTGALVKGNTVYVEGYIPLIRFDPCHQHRCDSTLTTSTTIDSNKISRVRNNNGQTWSAFGINLGGGNTHVVQNNFVFDVRNDQTAGTGAFGSTFGAYGIRIASGTGHKVYHNSVHLFGTLPGNVSTNLTAAFLMTATSQTGVDVRNNIFSNQLMGGNPTGTRHATVALPSGGTATMNLLWNNNDYFEGSAGALSLLAQVGATFGTGEFFAANFNPSMTTPANNFRSYTSTLGNASNDDSSKAINPQFTSDTDLHIAIGSIILNMGATVGVALDIDGEMRQTPPDIGADEANMLAPPVNDIATNSVIEPPNGSVRNTTSTISPQASFTNTGSAAQTNVPVRFRIFNAGMMVVYDMTATIPSLNSGATAVVSFPSTMLTTAGTYTAQAIAELPGDENAGNNTASSTFTVFAPLAGGTYTVGMGGNYPSLTNPGGIFEAINLGGVSGNIVINIISDLTNESGQIPLNSFNNMFSITIKPSGAPRTVTGTAANLSLIKLNGADNVTIDGSLSGGTDRSLTLTYGNTGGTVIWIASVSASNPATGNTVKNCILSGNTGVAIVSGVLAGSGTTLGGDAEAANSNNTIQNTQVFRVQNAAFIRGNGTALDQNWLVTGNDWGSDTTPADKLSFRGMLIGNAQNFTVNGNNIHGVNSTTTTAAAMSGIQVALVVNGGMVVNNRIRDIKNLSATGTGAYGLNLGSSSTAAGVVFANNFVSDVAAQGSATENNNGFGIAALTGAGYRVVQNSVLLNTNQGATAASGKTAAVHVSTGITAVGAIELRDNALENIQTLGARYAVNCSAPATVFSAINYNDYFAQNVGFGGGIARITLGDWQMFTGQDANSLAVDPQFVSTAPPADLHLQTTSPLINAGTSVGILTDIDGEMRDSTPDIGADEVLTTNTCQVCHRGITTLTLLCNSLEYQRHLDHGDAPQACNFSGKDR